MFSPKNHVPNILLPFLGPCQPENYEEVCFLAFFGNRKWKFVRGLAGQQDEETMELSGTRARRTSPAPDRN